MGRIVLALWLALGAVAAGGCQSSSSTDDTTSDPKKDDTCTITTVLSGGVTASLGEDAQACLYTSQSVAFAPLGGGAAVILTVSSIAPEQTGSFSARVEINADHARWTSTACTVDVESNVKVASASDGGEMFDRYALKGHGSCSAPAAPNGADAGARDPVMIAPFTFTAQMLFY